MLLLSYKIVSAASTDAIKTSTGATAPERMRENNARQVLKRVGFGGGGLTGGDDMQATYPVQLVSLWEQKTPVFPCRHLALCDEWIKIPLFGSIESLNVSVAAGILIYEAVKQRGFTNEE